MKPKAPVLLPTVLPLSPPPERRGAKQPVPEPGAGEASPGPPHGPPAARGPAIRARTPGEGGEGGWARPEQAVHQTSADEPGGSRSREPEGPAFNPDKIAGAPCKSQYAECRPGEHTQEGHAESNRIQAPGKTIPPRPPAVPVAVSPINDSTLSHRLWKLNPPLHSLSRYHSGLVLGRKPLTFPDLGGTAGPDPEAGNHHKQPTRQREHNP